MGEEAAAALPTHTVEEVPETEHICHTCFTGSGVLTVKKIHSKQYRDFTQLTQWL